MSRSSCKLRLALDCLGERHRIGGIGRHEFAEPVHLSVWHFENPPDIAQHGAGLQRSERDDLRNLIAAIALLHIADHLVAALLAEVDIKVRHRDAIRIEEAFEQQREAQRIHIGDRQRIGDERTGARTAARTNRNAVGFRPFDEVGNDEEVAGELHLLDDADLEIEPLAIVLLGIARDQSVALKPLGKTQMRLPPQFAGLLRQRRVAIGIGTGEARQDRARPSG